MKEKFQKGLRKVGDFLYKHAKKQVPATTKKKEEPKSFFEKPVVETAIQAILFTAIPVLLFYLMEAYEHNAFEEVRTKAQLLNILLFEFLGFGMLDNREIGL